MDNKNLIIPIAIIFGTLILLLVPNIPFTESQFYTQNTDLNYSKVKAGDYDNLGLVFDGNKISVTPLMTDVNWCEGEKDANAVPQWDADSNCYVKANLSSSEVVARSLGWRGGVTASTSTYNRLNNALYLAGDSFIAKGDLNYIRPYLGSFAGSPNMSTISVCVHSLDGSSYIGANAPVCCYNANGDTTPLIASSTTNDLGSIFFFNDCDLNVGSKYVYVVKNTSATPKTQYFSYYRYAYSNSPNFSFYSTNGTSFTYYVSNPALRIGFTNGETYGGHTTGYSGLMYTGLVRISDGNANIINRVSVAYRTNPTSCVTGKIYDSKSNLIAESTNTLCFPKNGSTSGTNFNDFYFDSVELSEGEEYWFNHGGSIFGMTLHNKNEVSFYGDYPNGFGTTGANTQFTYIRVN
jgi:hypothetical protein